VVSLLRKQRNCAYCGGREVFFKQECHQHWKFVSPNFLDDDGYFEDIAEIWRCCGCERLAIYVEKKEGITSTEVFDSDGETQGYTDEPAVVLSQWLPFKEQRSFKNETSLPDKPESLPDKPESLPDKPESLPDKPESLPDKPEFVLSENISESLPCLVLLCWNDLKKACMSNPRPWIIFMAARSICEMILQILLKFRNKEKKKKNQKKPKHQPLPGNESPEESPEEQKKLVSLIELVDIPHHLKENLTLTRLWGNLALHDVEKVEENTIQINIILDPLQLLLNILGQRIIDLKRKNPDSQILKNLFR